MRGEWWIDSSGTAVFADGDIGDMNHEMYVVDQLVRNALSEFDIEPENEEYAGTIDNYERQIRNFLVEEEGIPEEHVGDVDLMKTVKARIAHRFSNKDQLKDAVDTMFGRTDARVYALQWDGWKRVKGREVETWELTLQDLKLIGDGLWDAYGDECEEEMFNIEVQATRTYYTEVPWEVIRTDDLGALRLYE
jgi:hypothetical protein